ncbi:hypothetical protein MKEN_00237300 [Mycena kentingensis (nom. inval.)]|nr:hypothetical protein MKEN_00237300 [Mycena kentingensis (nom. inval.)]
MSQKRRTIDDALLGFIGANTPPSATIDHALRYLGTWGGTDKLMMTAQYAAKLVAPYLLYRAQLQFSAGKRAKPLSLTHDGLYKFAGQLSVARRIMGFWGILAIFKGLSKLERSPPPNYTRLQLNLERLQGLSMLVFYPLEYVSFFSAPFTGPLLRVSRATSQFAELWSVRAWGAYVALNIIELFTEWSALKEEQDAEKRTKRRRQIMYQLVANVSRMPVIVHWSVVGGIYSSELLTSALSLISALASFRGGWENHYLPPPAK